MIKITRLPTERWSDYKQLRLEAVQDSPQSFLTTAEETNQEPDSEWQDKIKNMFFAVTEDDQLVGMVGCYSDNKEKLSHIAHIVSVYVSPSFRGQGIARQLLTTALDFAKTSKQIKKVQLEVVTTQVPAYHLYLSLGFQKVGARQLAVRVGDTYYDEILLEMILAN